ncbi:hypothetical protein BGX29_003790 [Mortierella sp. GBA35]|nr:hypothetical protein BGX29_003790 [Mortierella sp. GBA35]
MQSVYKAFEAKKGISGALQSLVDPQDITSSSDTPDQPLRGIKAVKMDMFFILAGLILMTFTGAVNCLGAISVCSSAAVLSSVVPSHLIGAAYGAYSVAEALAGIVSDFTYGPLYSYTMKFWPLLYYYVSAGLLALALGAQTINWRLHRRK